MLNYEEFRHIEKALLRQVNDHIDANVYLLINELRRRYDKSSDRYNFNRVLQFGNQEKHHGEFPLGFLLLALRTSIQNIDNLKQNDPSQEELQNANRTWKLLRALAGTLDVELWNAFETLFIGTRDQLSVLRDRVLFEQHFTCRQQTPAQTLKSCRLLFAPFNQPQFSLSLPFPLEDALAVVDAIFTLRRGPGILSFVESDIAAQCGQSLDRIKTILDSLSYVGGTDELEKLSFFNLSAGTSQYFPFIKLRDNSYVLFDRLLAGPATYEAIATAYRNALPAGRFDEILGKEGLEGALRQLLSDHGCEVFSGGYGSDQLECDAAVEASESIIFFEAKKKGLTRRSLSGNAETILFDVSQSLLDAQVQLARHEMSIRRDGEIRFLDKSVLKLGTKRVDRVSITLLDLGSLQDKIVLSQMLANLRGSHLQTSFPLDSSALRSKARFEQTAASMLNAFVSLLELVPGYDTIERFAVRSYSLSDLLLLLEGVSNPDDLAKNLALDRHFTTGIGDWYSEYLYLKNLPK